MSLWQRVVQANRPGPPEHSVSFRAASAASVCIAALACWSQGELNPAMTIFVIAATVVGNLLSYWRREHPWPPVKPILAVCAIGGFAWFISTVSRNATPGDIATVEAPLAVLFAWVLCTHAFDVPARRDVAYSLAGSAALMAVAAAQSVDLGLGVYVVAWLAVSIWGLVAMWQSMSGSRGVPWLNLGLAGLVVVVVALLLVSVLPAPHVSTSLIFPSSSANSSPVTSSNNLTDGSASLPAHAASPTGRDPGGRVPRVRHLPRHRGTGLVGEPGGDAGPGQPAELLGGPDLRPVERPELAVDRAGRRAPRDQAADRIAVRHPAQPRPAGRPGAGQPSTSRRSTWPSPVPTWCSTPTTPNGSTSSRSRSSSPGTAPSCRRRRWGRAPCTRWSPTTTRPARPPSAAPPCPTRTAAPSPPLSPAQQARFLQLPHPYPRVKALAAQITEGIGSPSSPPTAFTYDKVEAIEGWMSSHIKYTTDIPPLAPGADAVDSFLFGSRLGYCEQISTATVVMLRTLGIPARETVGYVPGSYNPITDLYDVQAKDAHAWVQVWFPGYGWQNFDPTADVPLANPSPGSVLAHSAGTTLRHLPWVPIVLVVVVGAAALEFRRRRLARPPTWAHQIAADLARGGARLDRPRRADEPLSAYGDRLAAADPRRGAELIETTRVVERYTYGGIEPSAAQLEAALSFARRFRKARTASR